MGPQRPGATRLGRISTDQILWLAPTAPVRAAHIGVTVATFQQIPPGARWLVCDTTACAHLTTRHEPDRDGYRCTGCGTIKGA